MLIIYLLETRKYNFMEEVLDEEFEGIGNIPGVLEVHFEIISGIGKSCKGTTLTNSQPF